MNDNAKLNKSRRANQRSGFSLIEVTISIAITAVALVSLMGMLPAGMRIMREAGDRAIETRIHQQVLSELQLTEWDKRDAFDSKKAGIRFYDDQGIQIYESGTDFDQHRVYAAKVHVPKKGDPLPKSIEGRIYRGVFIPGAMQEDPDLQLVIVEITHVFDVKNASDFEAKKFLKTIRTFQTTITKMGKDYSP